MKKLLVLFISAVLVFSTMSTAMAGMTVGGEAQAKYLFDADDTVNGNYKQGVDGMYIKTWFEQQVNSNLFGRIVASYDSETDSDTAARIEEYSLNYTSESMGFKWGSWEYDVNDAVNGCDSLDLPDGIDSVYGAVRTENAFLFSKYFKNKKWNFTFWGTLDVCKADWEQVGDYAQITGLGYNGSRFNSHFYYFDKGQYNDGHGIIFNYAYTGAKSFLPYLIYEKDLENKKVTEVLGVIVKKNALTLRAEFDLNDDYLSGDDMRWAGMIRYDFSPVIYVQYQFQNYTDQMVEDNNILTVGFKFQP